MSALASLASLAAALAVVLAAVAVPVARAVSLARTVRAGTLSVTFAGAIRTGTMRTGAGSATMAARTAIATVAAMTMAVTAFMSAPITVPVPVSAVVSMVVAMTALTGAVIAGLRPAVTAAGVARAAGIGRAARIAGGVGAPRPGKPTDPTAARSALGAARAVLENEGAALQKVAALNDLGVCRRGEGSGADDGGRGEKRPKKGLHRFAPMLGSSIEL
jgi:hypothetical protein